MKEARFFDSLPERFVRCRLCPHACLIAPGKRGRCQARENQEGKLVSLTYGAVTSVAMDPVEKKPLYHFHPGREVYSIGSWGCNLSCTFCQNYHISQQEVVTQALLPERAVREARDAGAVGIAYTYNEPVINIEYVLDCARAAREAGLVNVLVTNGYVNPEPLAELLEVVDAMNIDLKAFRNGFYDELCGGTLEPVLETCREAAKRCHVEITTLLIPEHNDAPNELGREAEWIADNLGEETPVHLSAFFPRYKLNAKPAGAELLEAARGIFRSKLKHVYVGNVPCPGGNDSVCASCGNVLVKREGYGTRIVGLSDSGCCAACGHDNRFITDAAVNG